MRAGLATDEVRASTSEAIRFYDRLFLEAHTDSTRQILAEHLDRHGDLYCTPRLRQILRPAIVDAATYRRIAADGSKLARAFQLAADCLASDQVLRTTLRLPDYLEPILRMDGGCGHSTMARLDGWIDPAGTFKVIEYNSEPQGLHVSFEMDLAFSGMPIAAAFGDRYPFWRWNAFDAAYDAVLTRHRRRGARGTPHIAVIGLPGGIGCHPDVRWIAYLGARGCRVIAPSGEAFSYDGKRLRADGRPIDTLIIAKWNEVLLAPERMAAVTSALRDGNVDVVNGLAKGLLASYKSTLELLSDPAYRHLFPSGIARVLDRCVPWTRVLGNRRVTLRGRPVDLLEHVSQSREQFVLKPSGGSGGEGVMLGWRVTQADWDRALHRRAYSYVVQERVMFQTERCPVEEDGRIMWRDLSPECAPFVWNGSSVSGLSIRTGEPANLHNASAGALARAVWILR